MEQLLVKTYAEIEEAQVSMQVFLREVGLYVSELID